MPSLADRLAESLETKAGKLPGTDVPAIKLQGHWVSLPHLSYGKWPPHNFEAESLGNLDLNLPCEHRWAQRDGKASYKTASWLFLKEAPLFSKSLSQKIRKARKVGFEFERGGLPLLSDFCLMYARHIQNLGSLPLPKQFFHGLLQGFDEGFAEIFTLRYQGKTVGCACNLFVEGFYENAWFATNTGSQKLGASYFLHDQMINRAAELSAEVYSFGRSTPKSGVHQFKRQWGTTDIPLAWYRNGQLITENPHPLRRLGKLLKFLPFPLVARFGNWAFKRIY